LRPDIIASVQILCVINEPAAATIAYGLDKKSKFESRIIVTYPPNNKAEKTESEATGEKALIYRSYQFLTLLPHQRRWSRLKP